MPMGAPLTGVVETLNVAVLIKLTELSSRLFTTRRPPSGLSFRSLDPGAVVMFWITEYVLVSTANTEPGLALDMKAIVPAELNTTSIGSGTWMLWIMSPDITSTTSTALPKGYVTQASVPSGFRKTDCGY